MTRARRRRQDPETGNPRLGQLSATRESTSFSLRCAAKRQPSAASAFHNSVLDPLLSHKRVVVRLCSRGLNRLGHGQAKTPICHPVPILVALPPYGDACGSRPGKDRIEAGMSRKPSRLASASVSAPGGRTGRPWRRPVTGESDRCCRKSAASRWNQIIFRQQ